MGGGLHHREFCPLGHFRDHRGSHLTTDDVLRNDTVVEPDGPVTFDDGYGQGVTVRFDIT